MSAPTDKHIAGFACGPDGCRPISQAEAGALLAAAKAAQAERAARMPDEATALRHLTDAVHRLHELGWRDATYAPTEKPLDIIEAGCSAVLRGTRDTERRFWVDDGEVWPSDPILFREKGL